MTRIVSQALADRAERTGDQPFVKCGDRWTSAAALQESAFRAAAGLAACGTSPGDRVAVILPNRAEMIDIFFGCARLGAVQVPLNYWLKGDFLAYQLIDSGATVLIADEAGWNAARPLLDVTAVKRVILVDDIEPDARAGVDVLSWAEFCAAGSQAPSVNIDVRDPVAIIYTSGTTGDPKGCLLSNGYFTATDVFEENGWVVPGDRIFTAFPLFHTSGTLLTLLPALTLNGSVCYEPQFSASTFIWRATEEQATVLAGVGPMGMAILAQPPSPDDGAYPFRLAQWIPMPEAAQLAFEERFKTPVVAEGYGQTECAPLTMSEVGGVRKRSTAGRPIRRLEVAIVDDDGSAVPPGTAGEIVVRPKEPAVMFSGYWNRPGDTLDAFRDLWHHTGDQGRLDDDGFLIFVDRKKDGLRRRGENISSLQLEAAIAQHADVAQAAVYAVPSPLGEDDIAVCLVAAPGAVPEPAVLFEHFKQALPYFAIPRYVHVTDALPVNAVGRVMKHRLRAAGIPSDAWDLEALGLRVARDERR